MGARGRIERIVSDVERRNQNKVKLMVFGFDAEPAEITAVLGVEPTNAWLKGDAVTSTALNGQPSNGWAKLSPADPDRTTCEEGVRALLSSLPGPETFRALPAGCDVQVTCTLFGYTERPYVYLPRDLLAALAAIGASLDVDVYDLTATHVDVDS